MSFEGVVTGRFRTPSVGGESDVQHAETILHIDDAHTITVQSPLWEGPYTIGDGNTFRDPRTDEFLRLMTLHQFHHFSTRQLSFVEELETRPGTSRFVRLGHMLDSAKLLQDLGATFEQQVQTAISDLGHPAGSHLRGDFMVGDYAVQETHDGDLWNYLVASGFTRELVAAGLLEADGRLAGSYCSLKELADPRSPRQEDIVECARPDNNADRAQFTLHEGVIIHDITEVREAVASIIRVETKDGERMAMRDPEAARLLYKLAVRHQSENWAEPLHRVVEELAILPDRYLFCTDNQAAEFQAFQDYYPVDYTRTNEESWHRTIKELGAIDPFVPNILAIAQAVAAHQRPVFKEYIGDDDAYKGPVVPLGITLQEGSRRARSMMSISVEPSGSELWIALPQPKYRGPIDSLVVTKNGLRRISEIDPELPKYADSRRSWIVPLLAKISVPREVGRELQYGIRQVNRHWSNTKANQKYPNPALRPPMPPDLLEEQIQKARVATFATAKLD